MRNLTNEEFDRELEKVENHYSVILLRKKLEDLEQEIAYLKRELAKTQKTTCIILPVDNIKINEKDEKLNQ